MSSAETILTCLDGGILTVTLNRPDALNALTGPIMSALASHIISARARGARVIIIEGAGRAFSAGMDLKALGNTLPVGGKIADEFDEPGQNLARVMRGSDLPIIAKVHGACFTGALEVAINAGMIYTTKTTKFGDTHAKFGLRPSWGMSQTLPRLVGAMRARELSFTARTFSGEEAVQYGLALAACDTKEELDALVLERAKQISAASPGSVQSYIDLYGLAEHGKPLETAAREAQTRTYEINDTEARLGAFLNK